MEKILYGSVLAVLYIYFRVIKKIFERKKHTFEELLPQEEINRFNFETVHRKIWLGFVILSLLLVYLMVFVFGLEVMKSEGYLKRIAKVGDRIIVYTTDGRYGMIFKQPIKKEEK
jgi:Fe2+ transport system protein B